MQTNTSLLWTLEEISHLVSGSGNPSETLTNIVTAGIVNEATAAAM